jgi:aspartyl/asparaginyl beta-hydroxylase (cupin superfamily)
VKSSTSELQAAWSEGSRALREGRPAEALAHFNAIASAGEAPAPVWLALALTHKALGDRRAELAALDAVREREPGNIRALILTADNHADAGDERAASAFYGAAIGVALQAGDVEPALQAEIGRALHLRDQIRTRFESHLKAAVPEAELAAPEARRVRRALDVLTGKSEIFLQQPKHFYFPELPNIQYAPRADFPWLDRVEAATDAIRAEVVQLLADEAAFSPYVEAETNRPFFDGHGMLGNPDWSAFYVWKAGAPVPENAARCPATVEALKDAPLFHVPGRTPSILFSLLRPGAHIKPHHGFTNARYVCHLPLIVPEGCAMRVGADTRAWVEGRACVFDDSIEHEAWNRHPDRLRVVMIFDVWRPELSPAERELVVRLLQAVDSLGGAQDWD